MNISPFAFRNENNQCAMLSQVLFWITKSAISTSPAMTIIMSGPLPTYRRRHEKFSRLFALNEWLLSWCKEQKLLFVNNWNLFWERPRLLGADGLHSSRVGAELRSDNISRTLRSIWLVRQFSNNCYDYFCSTHLNDRSTCSVQSIQTVSVPQIVRSKYKFNAGSRKNLIVIKPEKKKLNWTKAIFGLPKHQVTDTENSYCKWNDHR